MFEVTITTASSTYVVYMLYMQVLNASAILLLLLQLTLAVRDYRVRILPLQLVFTPRIQRSYMLRAPALPGASLSRHATIIRPPAIFAVPCCHTPGLHATPLRPPIVEVLLAALQS